MQLRLSNQRYSAFLTARREKSFKSQPSGSSFPLSQHQSPSASSRKSWVGKMRNLTTWTTLVTLLPLAQATYYTLSYRQPISHFSEDCTNAYNTPLTQCPELFSSRVCSMKCIQQLEEVSDRINTRCKGARAEKDTLIGLFFRNVGVGAVCSNVVIADNGQGSPTAIPKTTLKSTVQTVEQSTQTRMYSSRRTTQSVESQLVLTSALSSAAISTSVSTLPTSSASTSETPVPQPTINSAATLTQSPLSSLGSSTFQVASSSTSSSASSSTESQQDSDGNTAGDGGGGTPFDITVSAGSIVGFSSLLPTITCILATIWIL